MNHRAQNLRRAAKSLLFVLAFGSMALACKNSEPAAGSRTGAGPANVPVGQKRVQVTKVELGNALGDDKRVKTPAVSFSAKDTIFASVTTEGSGAPAELVARWTFQDGQVVNETKRSIAPAAHAVTEFSIQKPDGWPAGAYKVEVSLDGKVVETKPFSVQ